jgi:polyisoprenoid-binding protein YceI
MSLAPGTYTLGPGNGRLLVRTRKSGAAAKAGHNLLIEVTDWNATLELGGAAGDASALLVADAGSMRVLEGSGGMQALGEDDKDSIKQTIDDEILKRTRIEFRSSAVTVDPAASTLHADGELHLAGARRPIAFELELDEAGRLRGGATVKQTNWGIKPFSALFGTLKVVDEVEVEIDATLAAG